MARASKKQIAERLELCAELWDEGYQDSRSIYDELEARGLGWGITLKTYRNVYHKKLLERVSTTWQELLDSNMEQVMDGLIDDTKSDDARIRTQAREQYMKAQSLYVQRMELKAEVEAEVVVKSPFSKKKK